MEKIGRIWNYLISCYVDTVDDSQDEKDYWDAMKIVGRIWGDFKNGIHS